MQVEEQVSLAPFTTFKLGGPARFFIRIQSVEDIQEAIAFSRGQNLKTFFLGGGSNLLVSDDGFDGVVIKIELKGIEIVTQQDSSLYIASAGEVWDSLVSHACANGLWGLENLSGIPGTVGAAPIQNIGAYGAELKDTLVWVEVFDTTTNKIMQYSAHECDFGYRTSVFKKNLGRYVVLRVAFKLSSRAAANIKYKDLTEAFPTRPTTSQEVRAAVLAIRSKKFPDLNQEGTAGSFFLNPILSKEKAEALLKRYPEAPHFVTDEGIKIPLAWLLDHALHLRGMRIGGARLFEKQLLVVVTDASATTADVLALRDKIFSEVQRELNISVDTEVRII